MINRREVDQVRQLIRLTENLSRHEVVQRGTKNTHHAREDKVARETLFPAFLANELDAYGIPRDGSWVRGYRGGPSQPGLLPQAGARASDGQGAAGRPRLPAVDHTFSSPLLSAGIPLVEVAGWMGHSLRAGGAEVNMTSRTYAHATGEHREAALEALEEFVRRAGGVDGAGLTG